MKANGLIGNAMCYPELKAIALICGFNESQKALA